MSIQLNPTVSDAYETKTLAQLRQKIFDAMGFLSTFVTTRAETLGTIRTDIFNMLGMAAMAAFPPPGVVAMLNSFINEAQQNLYRSLESTLFGTNLVGPPPVLVNDTDLTVFDGQPVRTLALGMAKAHYGQEDGQLYVASSQKYLADLKDRLPPNGATLVNQILRDAQIELDRNYHVFRIERWFTWTLVQGQRFYSITGNDERAAIPTPTGVAVTAGAAGNYGSMSAGRQDAAGVLLPDGRILVVGGFDGLATNLATADVFDPSTGLFAPTGNMSQGRRNPAAVVLPDGLVLVTGGFNGVPLQTAEVWNPATGLFTPVGNMTAPRAAHTATVMGNGKVLITGASNGDGTYLGSAEIFDQATGNFTATGAMGSLRGYHTATLLPSGKVLVVGGIHDGATVNSTAELYDPVAGTFSATGALTTAVESHTATLLGNGRVAIIGGVTSPFGPSVSNKAQIYDAVAGTFSNSAGNLATGRGGHVAALLPSGKVIVVGGEGAGVANWLSSSEIFDPAAGTFSAGPALVSARTDAVGVFSPYTFKFYVIGSLPTGVSPNALATAEIYDYLSNTFIPSGRHTGGTSSYRVAFANANGGTTLASVEVSTAIAADTAAIITWPIPTSPEVKYALIYGRLAGVEQRIAQVLASAGQYIDTGTLIPSGGLPTQNTTGNIGPILDQRELSWVGASQGDVNWRPLQTPVPPQAYTNQTSGIPHWYGMREQIEIWPPPPDSTWMLRIKGYFRLGPFDADNDITSLDWEAVYLYALAKAKEAWKRPDAGSAMKQALDYIGALVAGSHGVARYIPGRVERNPVPRPVMLDSHGNPIP